MGGGCRGSGLSESEGRGGGEKRGQRRGAIIFVGEFGMRLGIKCLNISRRFREGLSNFRWDFREYKDFAVLIT
jgi:hypothetical protein